MPLIDPVVDKNIPDPIDYSGTASYQKAYQWNNTKWNTMAGWISPTSWKIQSSESYAPDAFKTIVNSNAGIETNTETRFIFEENELGVTSLVFYNKIIVKQGSILDYNNFLKINGIYTEPSQGFSDNGADGKFYFRLKYTGDLSK